MDKKVVDNKSKILTYNINDVAPYINWAYFFYAWSMNGKAKDAQKELQKEAEDMLAKMNRSIIHMLFLHCAKPTVMAMISSLRVHAYQCYANKKPYLVNLTYVFQIFFVPYHPELKIL